MRLIKIPESCPLVDAATDTPVVDPNGNPARVTWGDVVRALFTDPRVLERLSVFAAFDLRTRLLTAQGTVTMSDEEYVALRDIASQPKTIAPGILWSVVPFLRAIYTAAEPCD